MGFPDRLLLLPGAALCFIEFKRPGKHPTKIQQHWLGWLNWRGYRADVVRSLEGFKRLVDNLN